MPNLIKQSVTVWFEDLFVKICTVLDLFFGVKKLWRSKNDLQLLLPKYLGTDQETKFILQAPNILRIEVTNGVQLFKFKVEQQYAN